MYDDKRVKGIVDRYGSTLVKLGPEATGQFWAEKLREASPDYRGFARHAYDGLCEGSLEMDFGEIQDKLEECGIVERREVDPSTNEWDADFMYFWIEEDDDAEEG